MLQPFRPTIKIQIFSTLLAGVALLCGCSSVKFTPYQGSEVFQGTGTGIARSVDGIDFWEQGDADRKYQILGTIDVSHKHVPLPGPMNNYFANFSDEESDIAKAARDKGGDAVIFVNTTDQDPSGGNQDGSQKHHHSVKLVVVKYLDGSEP